MPYDPTHFPPWYMVCAIPWLPIIAFCAIIFIDAAVRHKSVKIGLLSIVASFIQLMGYGSGLITAWWKRCILGKDEFQAFEHTFYK